VFLSQTFSSIAVLGIDGPQKPGHDSMKQTGSYFDAIVFLSMFLLIERLIEAYSKAKAGNAVTLLGKLRPKEAVLIKSLPAKDADPHALPTQRTQITLVDLLENGDVVRISNGGSPPCDGVVIDGNLQFDESSLTGESKLVPRARSLLLSHRSQPYIPLFIFRYVYTKSTLTIRPTRLFGLGKLNQQKYVRLNLSSIWLSLAPPLLTLNSCLLTLTQSLI
jgi:magnesium-transporting ATPase (P-type)